MELAIIISVALLVLFLLIIILLVVKADNVDDITDMQWHDKRRRFGLPLSFTTYILTDNKLITRTGVFSLKEDEINLYRVTDKRIEMHFFERLFGCGTIVLISKDCDTPKKVIKSVKNVRKVANLLDSCIEGERNKYAIRGRDMMSVDDCNCND